MDGVKRLVSVPLQALMVGWGDVAEGHQGYAHSISFFDEDGAHVIEQWSYIGITSRNWLVRMEEHLQEMRSGSNKRFHAAWHTYAGDSRVMLCSELIVLNHSFDGIMAWEEEQVDIHMASGSSLNILPGGYKGLRLLHEHRLIEGLNISLEERENAISEYVRRKGGRAGVPNLFLARLWRDAPSDLYGAQLSAGFVALETRGLPVVFSRKKQALSGFQAPAGAKLLLPFTAPEFCTRQPDPLTTAAE